VWKLAVASPLPPDEAVSRIMVHFSSAGWDVYYIEGAYIAEGPRAYLGISLLSIVIGFFLFILHPLLTVLSLGVGVWLLSEKHAVALRYQNGMYLIVANTYEAYREAMRFANEVKGRIVHLEEEGGVVVVKTNYARALEDLGATVVRIAETSSGIESGVQEGIERWREREEKETELLTRGRRTPGAGTQIASTDWSATARYRVYLATLEEMYKRGEVKEEVYKKLKEEYETKLRELERS
jgi:hypothetical protein